MFYPIFLSPFFKECIWGGNNLKTKLNKKIPSRKTGESFEVSCLNEYPSKIKNGSLKDKSLLEVINTYPREMLGENIKGNNLPLLVKFLDAKSRLSVQVHPGDDYAFKNHNCLGKNEFWYILYANKNSKIILGLNDNISKDDFEKSILENSIENTINIENVSPGDCIFIPSGTVHALLEDVLVLEIQQSSDITYRIYDWNRRDKGKKRPLHIKEALDVIDFSSRGFIKKRESYDIFPLENLINIKYFSIDYINITKSFLDSTLNKTFHIYICTKGSGFVSYRGVDYEINLGDSFFIPASLNDYEIRGNLEVIKVYIN